MTTAINESPPFPIATITTRTPAGRLWIEVGTQVTGGNDGPISFNPNNNNNNNNAASLSPDGVLTGIGFGMAPITAGNNTADNIDLYIGSVIIAGADGNSWQVFPDGSGRLLNADQVSQRMKNLEEGGTLFAEVGNRNIYDATPSPREFSRRAPETSATAVTCYLLNLQNVTLNPNSND